MTASRNSQELPHTVLWQGDRPMQPQLSQRPQKKHPNTSRNEDKAPSHSHREELQRVWQYLGLQEGCALFSTTCPVSECWCQMCQCWHGRGCSKQHTIAPLQGWPSTAPPSNARECQLRQPDRRQLRPRQGHHISAQHPGFC